MADENAENTEPVAEQAAAASGSKKKLILAIAGVVVLLLAIGVPVTIMMLKGEKKAEDLAADAAHDSSLVPEGHNDEDEFDEGEEALGAIFPLEAFVLNLQGGNFVRCQMQLEFETRDVPRRFYAKMVPIRDAIISILTKRKSEDLASEKGKDSLKSEVRERVNELMRKEEVKNVYFTQFVVQ